RGVSRRAETAGMRRLVLLLAPLLGLPATAWVEAGDYTPPPGDCCPPWAPPRAPIGFLGKRAERAGGLGGDRPRREERFLPRRPRRRSRAGLDARCVRQGRRPEGRAGRRL